ncbi:type II toxin-antitoxin system death-on-curing family toxin [Mycoplasma capricolum subsp. capripneumoniae]|uniref:Fido domain-containing protein n=6 Tax=Mycoplasma capricolum TaxID=2095 RepID=A0A9N7B0K8_MYCCC|nr:MULTISPECIES: type II toxin-antitoxin system death-on-curing family toxin [Mycoplasma mycoides group]AJK51340.1 hypothetical protein MCCG_0365 [Mycoplasma capricolum subsp. capripneumoniae 87001]AOQ22486.1 death-on-curing family protein [Mycoplasma capricolum subsp. capripneumoniae M1601]KEY84227.1 hypothetical protein death-on-curing family protein [Mycoplasma capricolum subsp. capripneumoniae 99108]KEZ17992.1 Hypothetical protein, putative Fic-related protein [Mycoplasma capricolum subsp. 
MKKPINLSIYITLKTYNDIKNKVKKITEIPKQNIDYLPFSNKKRVYFNENDNSFYLYKKNKLNKWKINLKFIKIQFNQEFIEYMNLILDKAIFEAKTIFKKDKDDICFKEKQNGTLKSAIYSIINKFAYFEGELDIFDFVTEIFIRVLSGHYLIDGNKRTSLMILILLLKQFGYYFYWSNQNNIFFIQNYKKHIEKDLEIFTYELQEKNKVEYITLEIKKWIYSKTMIDLNFK